ncbi:MAG: hypothetical protein ACUVS4_13205 [Chloroflexaceae bacterium]
MYAPHARRFVVIEQITLLAPAQVGFVAGSPRLERCARGILLQRPSVVGRRCDVPSCMLSPAWRLKPRASGLPGRPRPAHEATPVAFVCVAGGFSPTGRGALHDGTSHP